MQIIAISAQKPSLGFNHHKEMYRNNKRCWNIRLQRQHLFFPAVIVLSTPQLEWFMDPGWLPGHVYFLSLVDAKYRAIWLYSALCRGEGAGGVILWHLSCLCKELAVISFCRSPCRLRLLWGAAALMKGGYPVPAVFPIQC